MGSEKVPNSRRQAGVRAHLSRSLRVRRGNPLLFDPKKRLLREAFEKLFGPNPGQQSADDGAQRDHEAAQGADVEPAV